MMTKAQPTPQKADLQAIAAADITEVFKAHPIADVNGAAVSLAKFGPDFAWHSHSDADEAVLVISGRIAVDFRGNTVEVGAGEFLKVPAGVEHRPRALTEEPVVFIIRAKS